jgi:hypothetical protein
VAIERLVEQRFELPAFSTLDRLVGRVRHQVHQHLYDQLTQGLSLADIGRLEALLDVRNGRTAFSRMKATPRGASLQHMRQWSHRLGWLESIVETGPLFAGIARTKVQQFAAEAMALDVLDMRRIQRAPRRRALLVCMLHQAQVHTRDQLTEMLLRRMRRTRTLAKEKLKELQDQHRELEEHMLAVFAEVIDETILNPEDNRFQLGRIKARCLVGTFPQSPRLAPCVRLSPHTAQHLWSFSMDIHEASVPISPAPQYIPRGQLARSLGTFGPIFPKARGLRHQSSSWCAQLSWAPTTNQWC